MLLLQPALVALFKKQNNHLESTSNDSMKAKIQDFIFSGLAVQCVISAQALIKIVDENMRAGTLPAWWYNISRE